MILISAIGLGMMLFQDDRTKVTQQTASVEASTTLIIVGGFMAIAVLFDAKYVAGKIRKSLLSIK